MWDVFAPLVIWLKGGALRDILATPLVATLAFLVPSSLIALGIGLTEWHETPLARWFGVRAPREDDNWTERARDLDKDGLPDF
ncbi:hypothetical protein U91I_02935 [alpha proteobacterium U9-1i]|nr:hypothetical protein U91I_02935 [alpha proteobacterium U9-1i]